MQDYSNERSKIQLLDMFWTRQKACKIPVSKYVPFNVVYPLQVKSTMLWDNWQFEFEIVPKITFIITNSSTFYLPWHFCITSFSCVNSCSFPMSGCVRWPAGSIVDLLYASVTLPASSGGALRNASKNILGYIVSSKLAQNKYFPCFLGAVSPLNTTSCQSNLQKAFWVNSKVQFGKSDKKAAWFGIIWSQESIRCTKIALVYIQVALERCQWYLMSTKGHKFPISWPAQRTSSPRPYP